MNTEGSLHKGEAGQLTLFDVQINVWIYASGSLNSFMAWCYMNYGDKILYRYRRRSCVTTESKLCIADNSTASCVI